MDREMKSNEKYKMIKLLEKKLINDLIELDKAKENIEKQLEIVRFFSYSSYLPIEGESISYKLGKVILETNIWNIHKLPKKLLAIRKYAKHRRNLITLSKYEIEELNKTIEKKEKKITNNQNILEIPKKFDISHSDKQENNHNNELIEKSIVYHEKDKNVQATSFSESRPDIFNISSILSITNEQRLAIYNKLCPTYHLMEGNSFQLENTKANIFVIESVWSGISENWKYALISKNMQSIQAKKLKESIEKIKQKNIPIVFIFDEKLIHYSKFKSTMKLADIILSSNKKFLDNASVDNDFLDKQLGFIQKTISLEYCNPSNPIPFKDKKNIIYIGEYLKEFNDDNLEILQPFLSLSDKKLTLYRNENSSNELYDLNPERWETIPNNAKFSDVIDNLKSFKFSLYIADKNEIDIPQKILDSLACGVPVISTRCTYLEEQFKDIVIFIDKPSHILEIIEKYEKNRWDHARLAHKGYRFVMENFSTHKFKTILEKELNGKFVKQNNQPLVSILMASMREQYIDRIITNISRQAYKNKEFIIITQNFSDAGLKKLEEELEKIDHLSRFKIIPNNSSATLGERQNQAASYAKGNLLAKFDDDDFYFENYLVDMVLPFQFGNYDMVGKAEVFFYLEALNKTVLIRDGKAAYREMDFVSGATFVIKKSTFDKLGGFIEVNQSEDSNLLKRLKESGGKIYSSDPFNFIVFRSKNVSDHTWQQKAEAFMNSSLHIGDGISNEITVI